MRTIAAGPKYHRGPGWLPRRVVLRVETKKVRCESSGHDHEQITKYVVHDEYTNEDGHTHHGKGDYFPVSGDNGKEVYARAHECWVKRCAESAKEIGHESFPQARIVLE